MDWFYDLNIVDVDNSGSGQPKVPTRHPIELMVHFGALMATSLPVFLSRSLTELTVSQGLAWPLEILSTICRSFLVDAEDEVTRNLHTSGGLCLPCDIRETHTQAAL